MHNAKQRLPQLFGFQAFPRLCRIAKIGAIILALFLGSVAKAQILVPVLSHAKYTQQWTRPGAITAITESVTSGTPLGRQTHVPITVFADTGLASGQYFMTADPNLDEVSANPFTIFSPSGFGNQTFGLMVLTDQTNYQMTVVSKKRAPTKILNVPILVGALGFVSSSGDEPGLLSSSTGFADANLAINLSTGGNIPKSANTKTGPFGFNFLGVHPFEPGEVADVSITVGGSVSSQVTNPVSSTTGSFHAFIDPTFQIDPSFPFANDFELIYSPGYSPTGVPEPSPMLLVFLGVLITIGVCLRVQLTGEEPHANGLRSNSST